MPTSKRWTLMILMMQLFYNHGSSSTPFQCQSSSDQVYTPNIPDSYFNDVNAASNEPIVPANMNRGTTYIFTIPSEQTLQRNCSGDVISIQYCYEATNINIGNVAIFNLLSLALSMETGNQFIVDDLIIIRSTPSGEKCVQPPLPMSQTIWCCDNTPLNSNQLTIPSSEYTFGVVTFNGDNTTPLAFHSSVGNYQVNRYDASAGNPTVGTTIPGGTSQTRSLVLLRFFIGTEQVTQETKPLTDTEQELLTTSVITEASSTAETSMVEPATSVTNTEISSTTEASTMATSVVAMVDLSISPLGGVIGGCVVVLIIMAVAVSVVVLIVVKRRYSRQKDGRQNQKIKSIGNALYEVDLRQNGDPKEASHDYAGVGPRDFSCNYEELDDAVTTGHKSLYAYDGASYEVPTSALKNEQQKFNALDEDIYMIPAKDETSLYAQLKDIMTQNILRQSVKLEDLLGSGQFGTVYKGVLDSADKGEVEVAVKTLKEGSGEEDRVKFLQEATIMGQFRHPNVVKMYGVITDGEPILLVLELLKCGDLREYLLHMRSQKEENGVDAHTLLSYCRQVASGMAYLSSKAFVHRDLAARNILVSEDEICKIADFGMSRDLANESYYVSHGGMIPVKWTAPEALHYKKYSSASDVWSYGALMYEIWSLGYKPFQNYVNSKVIKLIDMGYRLPPPPGCPRAIYKTMIMCWHPVTSQRPDFNEITQQLSLPDTKLLKWSDEDKSVHPEATKLGADLLCAQELYKDLQTSYNKPG